MGAVSVSAVSCGGTKSGRAPISARRMARPTFVLLEILPVIRNSDRRLPGRDLAASALVPTGGSPRAYQIAHFATRLAWERQLQATGTSIRMAGVGAKQPRGSNWPQAA